MDAHCLSRASLLIPPAESMAGFPERSCCCSCLIRALEAVRPRFQAAGELQERAGWGSCSCVTEQYRKLHFSFSSPDSSAPALTVVSVEVR